MRGLAIALFLTACHTAPVPAPIERATPVVHEPAIDAGTPAAEAPADAAIEEPEPPAKLSPLEQLPPSGENPLPEMPSQDLIDDRYALALAHAREPLGLALLLDIANAAGGTPTLDHVRYDDAWMAQWDEPAFAMIVTLQPPQDANLPERDWDEPLTCPKGTRPKHKEYVDWCARNNGVKHGPYRYYEMGYDEGEGEAHEVGSYVDGKKDGLWSFSESFSSWSFGAYVKGVKHGLWEEGNREGYGYHAYVDGKIQGRVVTKSAQGDDVTIGEHTYDRGILDGEFREWEIYDPYALVLEGEYDHGKKTGEWRRYDEAGTVRAVQHWDADLQHGDYAYFDETGAPIATGTMDHGTGDWAELNVEGELVAQGRLDKGVKQGKWGERPGFTWETGEYKDGKRTGAWVEYATFAGEKVSGGDYKNGLREGAWIWLDDGVVTATGKFAKGVPTGHWELTDRNGTQTLDLKAGKLVKLDGKKPTKRELAAFESWDPDRPAPFYELDQGELY